MRMCPVILCGGSGSRLWPASRETLPKQFLRFGEQHSLFQQTVLRITNAELFTAPLVICSDKYKFRIASELEELGIKPLAIITELVSCNTALAITLASLYLTEYFPQYHRMLVLASDHAINDLPKWHEQLAKISSYDLQNYLVTFGVVPEYPATGYGYIAIGDVVADGLYKVKKFIEKPSQVVAAKLVATSGHFWNSGMFLFNYDTLLKEIATYKPKLLEQANQLLERASNQFDFIIFGEEGDWQDIENVSIDYAVFELTDKALVYPLDLKWCDLGTWTAVYQNASKDSAQNAILGKNIYIENARNCLIYSDYSEIATVMHRVKDLNVIVTQDAILISDPAYPEEIKNIYHKLKVQNAKLLRSPIEFRPWGYFRTILDTEYYKVKLLSINPASKISLQYHCRRAEHWVVIKGVASITLGDKQHILEQDQSLYVPKKELHRIANNTAAVLEIIEVQIGDYLGEDDIIRVEDQYLRN